MSGLQDYNNSYINKINNVLKDKPDYVKGYANYLNDISLTTKYTYINYVLNFLNSLNKSIDKLTIDDFLEYFSKLEYKENGEETSSTYRIAIYSALKKFSTYLYKRNLISNNFMADIHRPKPVERLETIEKRKIGYLTSKEIKKYLNTIKENSINNERQIGDVWNKRDLFIIELFLITGIRCSALMKLDINNINFDNGIIVVTDKGNKVNEYVLPESILNLAKEWIEIRSEILKDSKEKALFISNQKTRMNQSSIYRVVNKYSKDIKGKHITPHKLRATYGTQLYEKTGDIYFVQECMHHSNPKTTELYIRGVKNQTKKASDIMCSLI